MTRADLLCCLAAATFVACQPAKPPPPTCSAPAADAGAVSALETANAAFATDVFGQLEGGADGGNFFYSPFSISAALTMTYEGAATGTAQQMAQALHVDSIAAADVPPAFAQVDCQVQTDGQDQGNQLDVANRLFGQSGKTFEAPFLSVLGTDYGAPLQTVDFSTPSAAAAAAQTIDSWVSGQTDGEIPQLLQASDVAGAALVLANAIYFKGAWASAFPASATQAGPFTTGSGAQVQVPLMNQTASFPYYAGAGFALLELPYQGGKIAMDVLLPTTANGLATLAASFTGSAFQGWVSQLSATQVAVTLPRFTLTSRFQLPPVLEALGMTDAFEPLVADFSGMDAAHDLYLSAVIHQATVDVDESGTTAAAATAVVATGASAVIEPLAFDADHPFLFVLRDVPTNTLLFVGQVEDPSQG
ncbi:MAG TPA: serpin family protein [Myxococcales bacterium]|nr:serpin family protein [Myxococcales bacterium]